ncbi:hypothetical protein NBT05_18120 [Aquimarina sp. ERC-38]|uniref:DUF6588 family protein n=1 Tax=Aquimarina sp. ERC-38 TaxID=2949996 RepID=UPI002247E097|nr:DUF6588 family protein [Aquimarina sp. ERC-38]UZO80842.1 hypothetical protein NBT05_18120 [Aquimarina sp. ERC-38]
MTTVNLPISFRWLFVLFIFFSGILTGYTQVTIDGTLRLGIADATRFSEDYFNAGAESLINNTVNGWYTTAETKEFLDFDIGLVTSLSFVREEKTRFNLNELDYVNLAFRTGGTVQSVANILGQNPGEVVVDITNSNGGDTDITLPSGPDNSEVSRFMVNYIQGSIGLIKGFELKMRYMPKMKIADRTKLRVLGFGIQNQLTHSIYSWRRFPVDIGAVISYTNFRSTYDFTNEDLTLEGTEQSIEMNGGSWLFSGIISTKRKALNFYGGFGLFAGRTTTDLLGVYEIPELGFENSTVSDPVSAVNKESGLRATLGTTYTYKIATAHLDYTLQNYSTITLGLKVGW